jgi:tetratricopeptide (TPR) repeat protein
MKHLITLTTLLMGALNLIAQDFYLPVSTTSETAKEAYYKAEQLASNVNIEEANAQLDKALEEDPDFFMAYILKLYYASDEKQPELVDKALAIDEAQLNEAEKIVRQQLPVWDKDPKAKIAGNMKALVAAFPETPQAYQWASLHAAFTDKDVDAAIDYAQKLKELAPDFAPNYNTLGYLYMGREQLDEAKEAFENYIRLAPKEPNAYDSMGEYYLNVKNYKKSVEYYEKAASMGMASAKERATKAREMIVK